MSQTLERNESDEDEEWTMPMEKLTLEYLSGRYGEIDKHLAALVVLIDDAKESDGEEYQGYVVQKDWVEAQKKEIEGLIQTETDLANYAKKAIDIQRLVRGVQTRKNLAQKEHQGRTEAASKIQTIYRGKKRVEKIKQEKEQRILREIRIAHQKAVEDFMARRSAWQDGSPVLYGGKKRRKKGLMCPKTCCGLPVMKCTCGKNNPYCNCHEIQRLRRLLKKKTRKKKKRRKKNTKKKRRKRRRRTRRKS